MKNQYSKFVKYLEKQDNIFVQRSGDSVYLTDGKVVLMLPVLLYDNMIRPLSGLLPELKEDCTGEKRHSDVLVTIRPDGMNIKNAVDGLSTEKPIRQSRFLIEQPPRGKNKKNIHCRIFKADGGDIIAVDETFVDMFADCNILDTWTGAGCRNTPLVKKTNDFMLVMLPIKVDRECFEIWKDV